MDVPEDIADESVRSPKHLQEELQHAVSAASKDSDASPFRHLAAFLADRVHELQTHADRDEAMVATLAMMGQAITAGLVVNGNQSPDPRREELAGLVRSRKHVKEVLRLLGMEDLYFTELEKRACIKSTQLERVLAVTTNVGLVERVAESGARPRYSLSPSGRSILAAIGEPAWLRLATALVRVAVKAVVRGEGDDAAVEYAQLLTQLPPLYVRNSIGSFRMALSRRDASELARALTSPQDGELALMLSPPVYPHDLTQEELLNRRRPTRIENIPFRRGEGRYAPRLDALAEHYVRLALDRVDMTAAIDVCLPSEEDMKRRDLSLSRSIISMSSTLVNVHSGALLLAYASPLQFDLRVTSIWHDTLSADGTAESTKFTTESGVDYGMVVRLFDPETTLSHFVLAGVKPSGTLASARYFLGNIEQLLVRFPEKSFGTVVSVQRGLEEAQADTPQVRLEPFAFDAPPPMMNHRQRLPLASTYLWVALMDALRTVRVRRDDLKSAFKAAEVDPNVSKCLDELFDSGEPLGRRIRDLAGLLEGVKNRDRERNWSSLRRLLGLKPADPPEAKRRLVRKRVASKAGAPPTKAAELATIPNGLYEEIVKKEESVKKEDHPKKAA